MGLFTRHRSIDSPVAQHYYFVPKKKKQGIHPESQDDKESVENIRELPSSLNSNGKFNSPKSLGCTKNHLSLPLSLGLALVSSPS